jgi:hypothetical protein
MQTRILGLVGVRSALALLCVLSGGAALAQGGSAGAQDGGNAGSASVSKFADMKVSVDATGERLVVLIPKLLKSVGADFSIDADIKNALLSSHLTNVKLQTALDTLMRVSDIPVQYKFEKGLYHFSKRIDPLPEVPLPPKPQPPGESVLPPPPTTVQDDIDVHNVQTYDLLRVLNGLFGVPVAIDPGGDNGRLAGRRLDSGGSAVGQGSANSHGSTSSSSIGSGGIGGNSGSFGTSTNGSGSSSQNGSSGGILNIFGHPIRIGNGH